MHRTLLLLLSASCVPVQDADTSAALGWKADGESLTLRAGADDVRFATLGVGRPGQIARATGTLTECADDGCVVERTWAGGREWWAAEGSGLRQSWTIDARPDGLGPLAIELSLAGATARATGDGLLLATPGGGTLTYTGLAAWDATGRALPAVLAPSRGGVSVRVDDTDAVYPVVVDPLVEDASWAWSADAYSNSMGTRLASGDFNGDGHGDLIAAALRFYGDLFVFYSDGTGLPATYDDVIAVAPDYLYMDAFDSVGDLNGDGYDDVAVGSTTSTTYGAAANTVYVYYGSAAGLPATASVTLSVTTGALGRSVGGGADVNGDGYDDLLVGGTSSSSQGQVLVYYGSATGVGTSPNVTLTGTTLAYDFAHAVVGLRDFNGDGYGDVAASAEDDEAVLIYLGGPSGPSSTASATLAASSSMVGYFGWFLTDAGDVDADGYSDLGVGSTANGGEVYVYAGGPSLPSSPTVTLTGGSGNEYFGSYWFDSLDGGFDADADGYDDLIVGASGSGRAYLYRGGAGGMVDSPANTLLRPDASATYYGETVVGLPDVNGDGADDVVVADTAWGGHQGGLWMYPSAADTDADGWSSAYDCDDTNPSVLPWHCADSRDLIVDGTSVTLSGDYDYRAVWVVNGGRITVRPYSGFRGTGFVSYSAEVVYVDASSSITATGAGYAGGAAGTAGNGSGAGGGSGSGWGGGGGFGGKGGWGMTTCASNSGTQGARYGSSTDGSLTMGSGGGGGQSGGSYEGRGGRGGGAIGLYADLVRIEGALHANGQLRTRPGYTLTGGAGSGGTVLISAGTFECSGTITAMGGNVPTATAAGSGGPGGGGRVQFGYDLGDYDACTFNVQQGTGGCAANASQVGSAMVLP